MNKTTELAKNVKHFIDQFARARSKSKLSGIAWKLRNFWEKYYDYNAHSSESWVYQISIDDFIIMHDAMFKVFLTYETADQLRTALSCRLINLSLEEQFALFDRSMKNQEQEPFLRQRTIACRILCEMNIPDEAKEAKLLCAALTRVDLHYDYPTEKLSDEELIAIRNIIERLVKEATNKPSAA